MVTPGLALVPVSCIYPAIVLDLDTGDNSSARAEQIEQQIGGGVCPTAGVRVTLHVHYVTGSLCCHCARQGRDVDKVPPEYLYCKMMSVSMRILGFSFGPCTLSLTAGVNAVCRQKRMQTQC